MALALCTACLFCCRRVFIDSCWGPIRKLAKLIEQKLIYNSVLRGLLEIYLMTAISMFNGLRAVSTDTIEEKISYLLALATAVLCVYFPCWAFSFVRRNRHKLGKPSFKRRYDSLYQNIDTDKFEADPFIFVFLVRRLVFAYVICNVGFNMVTQVLILDFSCTAVLAYYLTVFPMKNGVNNGIHIFNEIVVILSVQYLFLFTNYVPDPVLRYDLAVYFIAMILVNMSLNVLLLISNIIFGLVKLVKNWYRKRQHRIKMQKVQNLPKKGEALNDKEVDSQANDANKAESGSESDSQESGSSSSEPDYSHLAEDEMRPTKVQRRMYRQPHFQIAFLDFYRNVHTYDLQAPDV